MSAYSDLSAARRSQKLWRCTLIDIRYPSIRAVQRVAAMFVTAVAAILCGCGGGGGGGHDLTVSFSYGNATVPLFKPVNSAPSIQGLQGNTPHCAVSSGALPSGLAVGSDCAVVGVPIGVGIFSATISLTVDGFDNSLTAPITIAVAAPTLNAIGSPTPIDGQEVNVGMTLDHFPVVSISTTDTADYPVFPLQLGDKTLFQVVAGSPPQGLTLDPATGTLNGVPTGFGKSSMSITLTVSHGDASFTTSSVAVTTGTVEAPWTLTYPGCCVLNEGDDIAMSPTSTYRPVPGSVSTFQWAGIPPMGVVLDAANGNISGWAGTAGGLYTSVIQSVLFPDGTALSATSSVMAWQIAGPVFSYSAFTEYTFTGQPFSFLPTLIRGGMVGDVYSYSLVPTPGQNTPLPPWLNINSGTGELFGTGVDPIVGPGTADSTVVLSTSRNGHSFSTTSRVTFSVQ
jgi:Putative Ig domain